VLAGLLAATLTLAATPNAQAASPTNAPTIAFAKTVVHMALDDYIKATDGHLKIRGCPLRGSRSRVCDVRVTGPVPDRFRAVVTYDAFRDTFTIRLRRGAR
jgi:hypothetical protein